MSKTALTQYYHTRDPIDHLRINVVARKIGSSVTGKTEGRDRRALPIGTTWSHSFHWQEKKGASDTRSMHGGDRKKKVVKKKILALSQKQDSKNQEESSGNECGDAGENLGGISLCSYVEADNYVPRARNHDDGSMPHISTSHLVAATRLRSAVSSSAAAVAASTWVSNRDRVVRRLQREESFRQMHIVLRHDETDDDLVLATLCYYPQSGLLCVTPGFSVLTSDINDPEMRKKGPRLSTYHITWPAMGNQLEFALDNTSDLAPPIFLDDQRLLRELDHEEELRSAHQVSEWKHKHGCGLILDATTHRIERLTVVMSLISVSDISTGDPVRVEYEFRLPQWRSETENHHWYFSNSRATPTNDSQQGRSRQSHPVPLDHGKAIAVFRCAEQFQVQRTIGQGKDNQKLQQQPTLTFSVLSNDAWQRDRMLGCAEIRLPPSPGYHDMTVPLWKPIQTSYEALEEFFLGAPNTTALRAATLPGPGSTSLLSRFGAQSITTGARLRIRLHVILQSPDNIPRSHTQGNEAHQAHTLILNATRSGPKQIIKRSVQDILRSVNLDKRLQTNAGSRRLPELKPVSSGSLAVVNETLSQPKNLTTTTTQLD